MLSPRHLLRVVLCSLLLYPIGIQADSYHYEQYSLNEGLSQSTARVIYRDTVGMLWVGTKNGLNRYDGESIYNYFADEKEGSLPGSEIYCIAEDRSKRLWIGTNKGLCYYNPLSDSFVRSKYQKQPIVFHTLHLHQGELYSFTQQSLWHYNSETEEWSKTRIDATKNIGSHLKMVSIDAETLLIGTRWHGIYFYKFPTKTLIPFTGYKGDDITDILKDKNGGIWFSSYNSGLYSMQQSENGKWEVQHHIEAEKSLTIVELNGSILLGSDGRGVLSHSIDPHDKKDGSRGNNYNKNLPVKSIITLYADRYNMLWLGTVRAGLLSMHLKHIHSYGEVAMGSSSGLSTSTVLSFFQDRDMVWIGTDGEGINLFNPKTEKFIHYPTTLGYKVSSITQYDPNHLVLSTYNAGFLIFNKQTGRLTPLRVSNADIKELFSSHLGRQLYSPDKSTIFLYESKLFEYSIANHQIRELEKPDGVGGGRFYRPINYPNELLLYDLQRIYTKSLAPNSPIEPIFILPDSLTAEITMVDKDKSGNYWIGTNKGLFRLSYQTNRLDKILPDQIQSVSTLLIDQRSSIWLGIGASLCRYYIQNQKLYRYTKSDGVAPNEYLPNTRMVDSEGNLYIGGVTGFSLIKYNTPFPELQIPTFTLLNSLLDGQYLPASRIEHKRGETTLRLPWNHTSLQLNLFINTPTLSDLPNCRYKLHGTNGSYQPLTSGKIEVPHLLPGHYSLQVTYAQEDNQWSTWHTIVHLYIESPWWSTWWFYSLVALLAIGAMLFVRYRMLRASKEALELERQKNEQALSEEKIRFLINVSHELRTPLTLVYAPMRRMLEDQALPDALKAALSNMYKHVKNMKNIIDMVLDIRKMEMKNTSLDLENIDINNWLSEVIKEFELECEAKHIKVITEFDATIGTLQFDKGRCHKVLSNLLMNAIKFTDEFGTISVTSQRQEEYIYVAIEDSGSGIADTEVPHLFTRFYQTNHQKGGSGIGLSYAKTQIELHGGQIGYKPGTERGSIFWFTLPIKSVQSIVADNMLHRADTAIKRGLVGEVPLNREQSFDFSGFTALVAEDEKELRHFLKETLTPLFKKVIAVKDGKEALLKAREIEPDIIISDVMMPVMSGFELCKSVKSDIDISHIPVLLLTALSDNEHSLIGYKMGADQYLAKPFEVELLCSVIQNIFEGRRAVREQLKLLQLPVEPEKMTFSNADERFLERLIKLIEEHIDDSEINIDFFAGEMAMSRSSFYQKIKVVTGKSANGFMQEYKIGRAVQLLSQTDLPIAEIATQLGFSNQRYFSTVFKQITGKTPSEYRHGKDSQ